MSEQEKQQVQGVDIEKNAPINVTVAKTPEVQTSEKPKATEEVIDEAGYNYRKTKKSALGMFLVACAAFFGSIMSAVVNVISKQHKVPPPTITFTRSLFNIIINLICCAVAKVNPIGPYKEGKKFAWVILRGLFGGIQITCYFFAFASIPVGDATVLTFIAPILTGILAIWLLGEKWSWVDAVGSILAFVGVIITSKPIWLFPDTGKSLDPFFVFIAMVGSVAASLAYISVRKVGPSVSIFVLINYILLFTMAINIFQNYYKFGKFPWPSSSLSGKGWLLILVCTACGAIAQVSINRGLQLEMAGPATSMRFLDVVCSYIWQVFFIHEATDIYSIIGASLVSICLIMISLRKYLVVRKARQDYENLLLENK